jgi:hypothetical protein
MKVLVSLMLKFLYLAHFVNVNLAIGKGLPKLGCPAFGDGCAFYKHFKKVCSLPADSTHYISSVYFRKSS